MRLTLDAHSNPAIISYVPIAELFVSTTSLRFLLPFLPLTTVSCNWNMRRTIRRAVKAYPLYTAPLCNPQPSLRRALACANSAPLQQRVCANCIPLAQANNNQLHKTEHISAQSQHPPKPSGNHRYKAITTTDSRSAIRITILDSVNLIHQIILQVHGST